VQLGATLGREFPYALLQAVSPWDEDTVQRGLQQLVEAEFLYQQGLPPQATYLFKHALIQDAAYQSLPKSTRQQYHQHIAQVLEARFPDICETQPELLAQHYTEAGVLAEAIPYWQRAGERAMQRSANVEAISHLTKGLEVLKTLPDTPERTQHELTLQLTLAVSLMATQGYSAPEVERAYARARELCGQVGETPQLFPVLHGLWRYYLVRADFQTARQLVEQFLSLAQRTHDSTLLVEPHRALGTTLFWLGELTAARAHLAQAVALYNPQQRRAHTFLYGQDPAVASLSHAALALWCLGYPDQALQTIHEALTRAREPAHPFTLAYALCFAGELHQLRREVQAAQERTETEIALCTEQGFALYLARTTILRGWALAEQGQWEEGIGQMRQGLIAYRGTGEEVTRPYYLALLAEGHGKAGQVEQGLRVLAEALVVVHNTGVSVYEAELYRLTGELLLALPTEKHAEAATCFQQALAVARRQQAKS
jgi:predicted ATPase